MDWATILVQLLSAVGMFILEAIKQGSIDKALERPLKDILPGELLSVIAKRQADDAAEKKFGTTAATDGDIAAAMRAATFLRSNGVTELLGKQIEHAPVIQLFNEATSRGWSK